MLAANYQKHASRTLEGPQTYKKKVASEYNLLAFTFAQKVLFKTNLHFIEMTLLKIQSTEWYSRSTYKRYNCTQSGIRASIY